MKHRCLTASVAMILFLAGGAAFAQSANPRLDVGGQVSVLQLSDPGSTTTGIGPRVTFNLSRWFSIDGDVTFYPNDDFTLTSALPMTSLRYERRRTEAFAGVKIGWRSDRFGVFAKARPGVTRLTHTGVGCEGEVCALALIAVPQYRTEFAFDLGGILEYYPTARTFARVDLGDVIIRHRAAPPCARCTSHNFTSRLGFGLRF